VNFYQQHAPANLSNVDDIMRRFKGKEGQMFNALAHKYQTAVPPFGTSSSRAVPQSGAITPGASSFPSAVAAAATGVAGVAGPAPTPTPAPVRASARGPGPARAQARTPAAAAPPVPPASSAALADHRQRLVNFYLQHSPESLAKVDPALRKFAGKEAQMFQALANKYQLAVPAHGVSTSPASPRPPAAAATGHSQSMVAASPANFLSATMAAVRTASHLIDGPSGADAPCVTDAADHRQRLVNFYTQEAPANLSNVDDIMRRFEGKEGQMFTALAHKYQTAVPPFGTSSSRAVPASALRGAARALASRAVVEAEEEREREKAKRKLAAAAEPEPAELVELRKLQVKRDLSAATGEIKHFQLKAKLAQLQSQQDVISDRTLSKEGMVARVLTVGQEEAAFRDSVLKQIASLETALEDQSALEEMEAAVDREHAQLAEDVTRAAQERTQVSECTRLRVVRLALGALCDAWSVGGGCGQGCAGHRCLCTARMTAQSALTTTDV
jgi:hypothetical protein